jgi:choline transport protein
LWGIFIIIWLPFPGLLPVTKDTMNYAAPVWGACFLIAVIDWLITGHSRFNVPIEDEPDSELEFGSTAERNEVKDD